jgi:alkylhydroperoxidase family enzyme
MTLLRTPEASPLYEADAQRLGYIANYTRVFALAPAIQAGWLQLATAVRDGMDARRYQLATLVAARRLRSRYCTLAYAAALSDAHFDAGALTAVVADRDHSPLDAAEIAVLDFAEAIAADPSAATPAGIDRLRAHGLSDGDIFHVVAAVAIRRFFTAVLAATHTGPDDVYDRLDPALRAALLEPAEGDRP